MNDIPQDEIDYQFLYFCKMRSYEDIKFYLELGANVNVVDDRGETGLTLASWTGHAEIVKLLIENGANVNYQADHDGISALMTAVANGHIGTVAVLLSADADLNAVDHNGLSALDFANLRRHTGIVELIEQHQENQMLGNLISIEHHTNQMETDGLKL